MAKKGATPKIDASARICVLHGPEPMLKREYLRLLREAMEQAHGDIEQVQFDGESVELADVLDELRSYGLMQQQKLVVVEDADEFVTRHRRALERYAESPVDNATLVLRCRTWRPGKLDKLIARVGLKIKCEPPTAAAAASWLVRRAARRHERKMDKATADLLVSRLGVDLMRLDAETAKLALLVEPDQTIDRTLIEQVVGRGSDEQAWQVQQTLIESLAGDGLGSTRPAVEKVHELIELSGQSDVPVMYAIVDLMRKLHLALQMKRQGLYDGQICKELRLWPRERQGPFLAVLRRLDDDRVMRMFDRAIEADQRSKSGLSSKKSDKLRNLERLCIGLADILIQSR